MTQPRSALRPARQSLHQRNCEKATDEAVEKVMRTLGNDINDPDAIRRYHANQNLLQTISS